MKKVGWVEKSLEQIGVTQTGSTPNTSQKENFGDFIPFIKPADFNDNGSLNYNNNGLSETGLRKARHISTGSVLMVCIGATIGKCGYCDRAVTMNQQINSLTLTDGLSYKFIYYQMLTENFQRRVLLNSGQTTLPIINKSKWSALTLMIPSLPEQQRIVGILDKTFDGIATAKDNAEKNLENARALFESYLQKVFTNRGEEWDEKPLTELCDIKHGFAFKSEFFTDRGDYVVLTPGNFYESGGYRDRGEKQKYYSGEIPKGFILKKGDMLVAMTEQAAGLLGSPIIVPESDKFLHNQRLGLVIKKPEAPWTNDFFFHVFNTKAVRKEIHDSASGVKVRHTSPTKIGEVLVSFPTSISEQRAIVSRFTDLSEETERLESIYRQKLAALDELKKSLLHKAFAGEL